MILVGKVCSFINYFSIITAIEQYYCILSYDYYTTTGNLRYCSKVTSHLLATSTHAPRMLNMLNSITLKQLSRDKTLESFTHSKILTYNHVHTIKSKLESLCTFARDLILKSYAML